MSLATKLPDLRLGADTVHSVALELAGLNVIKGYKVF